MPDLLHELANDDFILRQGNKEVRANTASRYGLWKVKGAAFEFVLGKLGNLRNPEQLRTAIVQNYKKGQAPQVPPGQAGGL